MKRRRFRASLIPVKRGTEKKGYWRDKREAKVLVPGKILSPGRGRQYPFGEEVEKVFKGSVALANTS